ncbi:hypothetical protein Mgra_00005237, partial [Meloidogyne graminicola]
KTSLRITKINRRKTSLPVFNFNKFTNISSEEEKGNEEQVLTALPDLSDPCFRRYINSIIVNAQPYERRSSISLVNCKIQCLRSQVGHYTCRSFVYDNINQVCDLFAHVGDQPPASECHNSIYRRFPQMILVGFAETVVDSPNLQKCLDKCLKSQHLYGFICSSGMFYFEEPRLNCILNTESRKSHPELFTTEISDLVDYFETGKY